MKIGSGWTKNAENGDTYISVALDEVIYELHPQLKGCYLNLWHVKKEDRKADNSPQWQVTLNTKKEKQGTDKEFDDIIPA